MSLSLISNTFSANERCQLDSGLNGTCKHISSCPVADLLLQDRSKIKSCESVRKNVVCCPELQNREKNTTNTRNAISQQKCEEYSNMASSTVISRSSASSVKVSQYDALVEITGGVPASQFEYPHMALLGYKDKNSTKWLCGGSIISEKFIITAAHCIITSSNKVKYVAVGAYSLSQLNSDDNVQKYDVKETYVHREYNVIDYYNDIALIEINGTISFDFRIRPACLHNSRDLPEMFMITGWGSLESGGQTSNILQKATVVRVNHEICTRIYGNRRRLPNGVKENLQICARGSGNQLADTCQGDSGGPLQVKMPLLNIYTVVGITSFGIRCGITASVYTRVSNYVPWVEKIVWPESSGHGLQLLFEGDSSDVALLNFGELQESAKICKPCPNYCTFFPEFLDRLNRTSFEKSPASGNSTLKSAITQKTSGTTKFGAERKTLSTREEKKKLLASSKKEDNGGSWAELGSGQTNGEKALCLRECKP
ncbi:hypothetical protein Trydic_g18738 [Trypoxylus dichotomus]